MSSFSAEIKVRIMGSTHIASARWENLTNEVTIQYMSGAKYVFYGFDMVTFFDLLAIAQEEQSWGSKKVKNFLSNFRSEPR